MKKKSIILKVMVGFMLLFLINGCSGGVTKSSGAIMNVKTESAGVMHTQYQPGQIIEGIETYSGQEYLSAVLADDPNREMLLYGALPQIAARIEALKVQGQNMIEEGKFVIYHDTVSLVLPLAEDSVITGKQRLELYQYQLSAILRAVEAGLGDAAQGLSQSEKEILADFKDHLSITFVNQDSDTLIFYPNGVFILNEEIIEKANRNSMDEKLNAFFTSSQY